MNGAAAGSSSNSGDVSLTSATDQQGPRDPLLYVMGYFAPLEPSSSRVAVQLRLNAMDPTVIFLESHDGDGDGDGGFGAFGLGAAVLDPASGVAIASLPEATVEARDSGECAVCLDEYVAGDALRTMPCSHGFHESCIFRWLRVSRLCPLCRFALPPET